MNFILQGFVEFMFSAIDHIQSSVQFMFSAMFYWFCCFLGFVIIWLLLESRILFHEAFWATIKIWEDDFWEFVDYPYPKSCRYPSKVHCKKNINWNMDKTRQTLALADP